MNKYEVLLGEGRKPYIKITRKDKSIEVLEGLDVIKFLSRIDESIYGRKDRMNPLYEKDQKGRTLIYINKVTGKNIRIPHYQVTTTQLMKLYEEYRQEYEHDKNIEVVKGVAKTGAVMIGGLALLTMLQTAQKEADLEHTARFDEETYKEYNIKQIDEIENEYHWDGNDEEDHHKKEIFEPIEPYTVSGNDASIFEPIPEEEKPYEIEEDIDEKKEDPSIIIPKDSIDEREHPLEYPEPPETPVVPSEPKENTNTNENRSMDSYADPATNMSIIDVDQSMITDEGKIEQNKQLMTEIGNASRKTGISYNILNDVISQEWSGKEKNIMHIIPESWMDQVITFHNYEKDIDQTFVITEEPSKWAGKVDFTITKAELENRQTNINVGADLIQYCLKEFDYNILLGLQAYNNGINAVKNTLEYTSSKTGVSAENIINDPTNTTWMTYVPYVINNGDPNYAKNVLKRETDYDYMFSITEDDMENYSDYMVALNDSVDKVYTVQSVSDNGEIEQESQGYKLR